MVDISQTAVSIVSERFPDIDFVCSDNMEGVNLVKYFHILKIGNIKNYRIFHD